MDVRLRLQPVHVLPLLVVLACARRTEPRGPARGDIIGVDAFGDTLRVPARPPRRIVSLNPTTTEIVFAVGAGARLVGRSHWDSFPDSARLVPDLGPALGPNMETVIAAHPDLVLLYASADDERAAARLRDAGIPVAALRIDRIDGFRRATRDIGALLGDSARAADVVDSVTRTLDRVRAATRDLPRPTVAMVTWQNPVIVIGGGSFISELIQVAGGRNVYADLAAPSPTVSLEDLVRRDPDVLLASPNGRVDLERDPRWQAVRAVREHHVLVIDTMLVGRPSPVMGQAAVSLARLLHPGILP
jgi:ABC-type Fe3+-hydroxamate transport system substrate-binding protein